MRGVRICFFIIFSAVCRSLSFGEILPLKRLSTADGLPQNTVTRILQDDKGFVWIATNGGLARFDGYDFVNFKTKDGLPANEISDIYLARDKDFWLATGLGLVKFQPDGKLYDRPIKSSELKNVGEMLAFVHIPFGEKPFPATKVFEDSKGTVWVGTNRGLYYFSSALAEDFKKFPLEFSAGASEHIYSIYEDRSGAIWCGAENRLFRISPDKKVSFLSLDETKKGYFMAFLEDSSGTFWAGTTHRGLFRIGVDGAGNPFVAEKFAEKNNSVLEWIDTIKEGKNGILWIGGVNGLYQYLPKEKKLFRFTRASGLSDNRYHNLFFDKIGNLWIGTRANGFLKMAAEGLVTFGTEDKISFVRSVKLNTEGELFLTAFVANRELDLISAKVERDISAVSNDPFFWRLGKLETNGFIWIKPKLPEYVDDYGWGDAQISLQAKNGEWWIVTGEGLFRFPNVKFEDLEKTEPIAVFDKKHGLNLDKTVKIFEDSQENIWITTNYAEQIGLYKWERKTETLHDVSKTEGYEAAKGFLVNSFAEDGAGNIWLGTFQNGFGRIRNGKFVYWNESKGIPRGGFTAIFLDREKRLWFASRQNGLWRCDNPEADEPTFKNYTEANGLSSNRTLSITQDLQGYIYVGTDRNISRLNPQNGEFKTLNVSREQLQREFRSAVTDKNGVIWFGTTEGLVKYEPPKEEKTTLLPEVLITEVFVESLPQKISLDGAPEVNLPELAADQNQVRINFVSLANFEDENIRYQYKFDRESDWSPLSKERFVNFANLSPNNYRLLIRGVSSDGVVGINPAVVTFVINQPFYFRWWFIALSVISIASFAYLFYRLRVQKLLEVERTRTLIATDLHDDIGSNLSKISVLSEVVKMQLEHEGKADGNLLTSIADISRESVGSMRDIIWAINPNRDSVLELSRKMREYAESFLVPKNIEVNFPIYEFSENTKLSLDLRRELLLIFKEIINNIAKHSEANSVDIKFENRRRHEVFLEIADNGKGFDTAQEFDGNGIKNLKSRTEKLKGHIQIESAAKQGTKITLQVPNN